MITIKQHLTEAQTMALRELSAALEDYQTQLRVMERIRETLSTFQDQPVHPRCHQWNGGFATQKPLYIRSNGKG